MTTIYYTQVDEAPALATYSLLPILRKFIQNCDLSIVTADISLAARILASCADLLPENLQQKDELTQLGALTQSPTATIIKLPNISASLPQLNAAIAELQKQGYPIPNYTDAKDRYTKVLGSAVNPVLREGNSDRRAPKSVKNYAKTHPHTMGAWSPDSKTHVSHMSDGDFYGSEIAITLDQNIIVHIEFEDEKGQITVLKPEFPLLKGEIINASFLSVGKLQNFYEAQLQDAKNKNVLFSLHLKATMMKVSDPLIFGYAVATFFKPLTKKYAATFKQLSVNYNTGLQDLLTKIATLPQDQSSEIMTDLHACLNSQPALAMVNSEKGITNLHVPSDVIVDASMPAMIRESGKMWGPDGLLHDTKAVIPDRCYAGIYQVVIDDCKAHGAYDPQTMGSVSNVGLMAQQAEEYGSHNKTFESKSKGSFRVVDQLGKTLLTHNVNAGDIWRMCQVKDASIQDWVKLAIKRAQIEQVPAIFWLDPNRAHDREVIKKVNMYLNNFAHSNTQLQILSPIEATKFSLERIRKGQDTISVTGNVLRDYNTDLFPILEIGTSSKMLSIVPLMNGGGLFETGAGGSAPKLVQQFLETGHLRWDSLGEFLAIGAALDHLATLTKNNKIRALSTTLDQATEMFLNEDKSPKKTVGELDIRGSHFYMALYWAKALSEQTQELDLKNQFSTLYAQLRDNETQIVSQLNAAQGKKIELGGYYHPDIAKTKEVMCPSSIFNKFLEL